MKRTVSFVALLIPALLILLSLAFMVSSSFMDRTEIGGAFGAMVGQSEKNDLHVLPRYFSLEQYRHILWDNPEFLTEFWNTMALVLPSVILSVIATVLGTYAFAFMEFPLKEVIFAAFIVAVMLPYQVILVANFIMADMFHLLGTRAAVILPNIFAPIGVFYLRGQMEKIPKDTMEAAEVDGAGPWRRLIHIVLPQSIPGISVLALLEMIDVWNQVEPGLVLLRDAQKYPLSITLSEISAGTLPTLFASCVIYLLPMLLIFLFCREYLMEELSISIKKRGVKDVAKE